MRVSELLERGWVVDEWRNRVSGLILGWPEPGYVGMKSNDLPWMVRKQALFYCSTCQRSMVAGPDAWEYCTHNQPQKEAK